MLFERFRNKTPPPRVQDPSTITTRTQLLNYLISAHGYRSYLEIGVRKPAANFDFIDVPIKHGVDPAAQCTYPMTSDEFFAQILPAASQCYDLVFVDGLHLAEQVMRDVENALRALNKGGTIVLHDVNPMTAEAQTETYVKGKHWNGTVWQAWATFRGIRPDLFMCVIDIDEGCGIIRPGRQELYHLPTEPLSYAHLAAHRREILNLVTVHDFLRMDREFLRVK